MAASVVTYSNWNSGTLVTATGTLAEVMTVIQSGTTYELENPERLMSPPYYNGTNITAIWYSKAVWT